MMSNQQQSTKVKHVHDLYHEAKRRAAEPQPIIKHEKAKSLLLSAPNNIIFELFNTIVKELPGERILEFITNNLADYLNLAWDNKITQRAILRLRREQAADMKAGLGIDAPIIVRLRQIFSPPQSRPKMPAPVVVAGRTSSPAKQVSIKSPDRPSQSPRQPRSPSALKSPSGIGGGQLSSRESSKQQQPTSMRLRSGNGPSSAQRSPPLNYGKQTSKQDAVKQVYEHIMWRIKSGNVTQITSLILKLALDDGYKRGKLKAELYDDVEFNFKDWRSSKLIKLYAFGDAPANDQKLLLSSTDSGDLTSLVANYIDGSDKRQNPDLIRKLASALRDKTKNCIFITNDLSDALRSLETGSLRCAFVVDRLKQYDQPFEQRAVDFSNQVEPLIVSGKLYILDSLNCVEFAPDPTADNCC